MISGRLTMRAAIERDTATAKDAWGNPVEPIFASTGDPLPCFVWSISARQVMDGGKTAEIENLRAMFALNADVQPGDEIAQVTDRRGTVLLPGRLRVEAPVQRKHSHLEAGLRRIG